MLHTGQYADGVEEEDFFLPNEMLDDEQELELNYDDGRWYDDDDVDDADQHSIDN